MPETKTRFIPKPDCNIYDSHSSAHSSPNRYYGSGVSSNMRLTAVGPVNPDIYGDRLMALCRHNQRQIDESDLRVRVDNVSEELEKLKNTELVGREDDSASICSEPTTTRWQCRETRMKYTGSLDSAKRDYFNLEDIDNRSDVGAPADPINGYCYLCSTQEEHRQHLKSERKVKGQPLRHYDNPVKPDTLPTRPFSASSTDSRKLWKGDQAIYKVVVVTGNQTNGGTDAQVTLRMYGLSPKEKTPKIVLKKPGPKFMFMRDSTNSFGITAQNLSDITSIDVETDGYEMSQSWYLESVRITNMKTKQSYYFPCSDWLSLYHEGESLGRKLVPVEEEKEYRDYEVTVVTAAHRHSGTDSKVYLTLVGSKGRRSKKRLLSRKNQHCFRKGSVDTFSMTLEDIGPLSKIRIEHDDKGKSRRWLLLLVYIKDLYAKKHHLFFCNQWLVNEEGNAVWREIVASKVPENFDLGSWGGQNANVGGEALYEINVHTGDVGFAGTDANVLIQLYGDKSQSKRINLSEIQGNYDNPFEKNQVDIFQLKAADVGELKKIKIGHDNKGVAAGWYLEKVLVRKFIEIKTRVSKKSEKSKGESKEKISNIEESSSSESESERSASESDISEKERPVIGRHLSMSGQSSTKSKSKKEKKKKGKDGSANSTIRSVTSSKLMGLSLSDSDKDIDESMSLSDDSDEDLTGSATNLNRLELEKRKRAKEEKRRKRMDNLSDVAEMTETGSDNTSVWGSEEMPTIDRGIEEALRLKKEHDKLSNTMEKVVPKVEEYTFICKQWFAESEGDGKIERVLRVSDKKVYNRSDEDSDCTD